MRYNSAGLNGAGIPNFCGMPIYGNEMMVMIEVAIPRWLVELPTRRMFQDCVLKLRLVGSLASCSVLDVTLAYSGSIRI